MARKSAAPTSDSPVPPAPEVPNSDDDGDAAASRGDPPVWKKRLYRSGSVVECAAFRTVVDQGQSSFATHSAALRRTDRDGGGGGDWKETRSLRRDDLLVAAHVLQRAYAFSEQEQS